MHTAMPAASSIWQVGQGEVCALSAAAAIVVLMNRGWLVIDGGGMACSIVLAIMCLLHQCVQLRAFPNILSNIRLLMNRANNECADDVSQGVVAGSPSTSSSLCLRCAACRCTSVQKHCLGCADWAVKPTDLGYGFQQGTLSCLKRTASSTSHGWQLLG